MSWVLELVKLKLLCRLLVVVNDGTSLFQDGITKVKDDCGLGLDSLGLSSGKVSDENWECRK